MEKRIYTVTQVNNMVKVAVEANLPGRISVAGEMTSYRPASRGHKYFTIKDESCQLPCVMWKSTAEKSKFEFANGVAVVANGHIEVYAPFGKYQFIVDTINLAGVGNLQIIFEKMVAKLEAEGLFESRHKKPIPRYPMRIGIVTSATGAAVADISDSISSRFPCAKLFLYPVSVQGKGAEVQIAEAIADINARNEQLKLDLLIVGRGGGSIEDLWCFNEEITARAIFGSKIPIISAVGHEVDTTIADLVADARASTPTRAGVIAVPDANDIKEQIGVIERRLKQDMKSKLQLCSQKLATVSAYAMFRNPEYIIQIKTQQADEYEWRLKDCFAKKLSRLKTVLDASERKVRAIEPSRLISKRIYELQSYENRLKTAVKDALSRSRLALSAKENRLETLDPKSVLNRGYTITTIDKTGKLIKEPDKLKAGETIKTEFAGGKTLKSKVERSEEK